MFAGFCRLGLVCSESDVETELPLYDRLKLIVGRSSQLHDLFINFARTPFEERFCVRANGIAKLPAGALHNFANLLSDDVRRGWLGQRGRKTARAADGHEDKDYSEGGAAPC